MDGDEIIIAIALFIVISVFIIVVIVGWYISQENNNTASSFVITQPGGLLSPCTDTSCVNGLICDGSNFTCKLPPGSVCSDFSDCAVGYICSGLCATGPTGGLNQLCPCSTGYLCTLESSGLTVCKGASGTVCKTNNDCSSNLCLSTGVCSSGAPNSFPCSTNSQCASNNCNNGFCQNIRVISGTLGSACAGRCVGFTGASCIGTISQPLACECVNGNGSPGACIAATQGISSVCSEFTPCSNQLVCYNNNGVDCGTGNTGCLCSFTYEDVNTGTCISGMSSSNNTCFNNIGLGCDSGGLCFNRACGGNSVLAMYRFSTPNISNTRTQFINTTTTTILPAMSGPNGIIQPHKMFAISSGDNDTIYLVDNLQGLLFTVFNPITSSIITPWTILIPHIQNNKTLIDVGYNGTNFIVAFHEQSNDTVYIGTNTNNLVPFNVQSGSGITGTQYTTSGVPLSINYIDISRANDVTSGNDVLISFNGTIYVKQSSETRYSIGIIKGGPMNNNLMTGLTGPASFYFDNGVERGGTGDAVCPADNSNNPVKCPSFYNIAFVGPFTDLGVKYEQVLQFSGNIAGAVEPIDRFNKTSVQYKVYDYSIYSLLGMQLASIVMLTNVYQNNIFIDNMVAITFGGSTVIIPYKIGNSFRSVATNNAFYVLSIGSCT